MAHEQQQAVLDTFAAWQRGETHLAPVTRLLGITPVSLEPQRAVIAMDAGNDHHNVFGTLHGGLLCALADVAMGIALATTLQGEGFTTLEQAMSHLRSVSEARLVATGSVVRRGRQAAHLDCTIAQEDGREIARATSSCLVFPLGGG